MDNKLSYGETPDHKDWINYDVAAAVWPLAQKIGTVNEGNYSPDDFTEEVIEEAIANGSTRYQNISIEVHANKWGLERLWVTIDPKNHLFHVQGGVDFEGQIEPEDIQDALGSMVELKQAMIAAGYTMTNKGTFDDQYYDMEFEKAVDTEDPQKVYAALDEFVGILT